MLYISDRHSVKSSYQSVTPHQYILTNLHFRWNFSVGEHEISYISQSKRDINQPEAITDQSGDGAEVVEEVIADEEEDDLEKLGKDSPTCDMDSDKVKDDEEEVVADVVDEEKEAQKEENGTGDKGKAEEQESEQPCMQDDDEGVTVEGCGAEGKGVVHIVAHIQ